MVVQVSKLEIACVEHPLFYPHCFQCAFPSPLSELACPDWLLQLLNKEGEVPLDTDQVIRDKVRGLLRWGGFKPSGRSKPASEFLEKAGAQGSLGSINLAVDLGNAVSLWSGLPISVVDLDSCRLPLRVEVIREKLGYVFNPSGQELDVEGLLCLCDADGPCASPVKDSQRTKTSNQTTHTLCLIWGEKSLSSQVDAAHQWYRTLCQRAECQLGEVDMHRI